MTQFGKIKQETKERDESGPPVMRLLQFAARTNKRKEQIALKTPVDTYSLKHVVQQVPRKFERQ